MLDGRKQVFHGDAEFVFVQSCRDFGMGVCIHVGVDAEGDGGFDTARFCQLADDV